MAGIYVDTSSLGRVLLAEPDAAAIRGVLGRDDAWWSSDLLTIELRRLARRTGLEPAADRMLATVQLTPVSSVAIERASRLDPLELRTLDAITSTPRSSSTAPAQSRASSATISA